MIICSGKSVLKGVAIGKIYFYKKQEYVLERKTVAEVARFEAAKAEAMEQLDALYHKALQEAGEEQAMIFDVHKMMLDDGDYLESICSMIRDEKVNAEYAVSMTGENFSAIFASMDDDYMKARAVDVKDISGRVVNVLAGIGDGSIESDVPVILLADDLSPSETVQLDKSKILAFVTKNGSANSHTAILARSMNIPALVKTDVALLEEYNGIQAVVDGIDGTFIINPDEETSQKMIRKKMEYEKERTELLKLIDQFICTPKYVRKKVREYLQSGRNEYSLMDRRKMIDHSGCSMVKLRGAKPKYYDPNRIENDEKLKSIYDEYFAQFLNSSEKLTIQAVYDEMVAEHFENTALAPPTYRRFNYYVNRRLEENNMTLKQAKMNARERRNNHRLLKGNAQSGVYYPGQMLEIDAVELDNYNVSLRNRSQLVGKGVMYCAVDVYSCCLVACWIGFENNSITGITDLLYTLLDDHTEEAARYGVELTPELFPSRFIPTSIRTDHGAEYESKEFSRMCKEMGINHHFVAPATGSLKGTVEQFFHQFQTLMKSQLVDAGETYRRYNSNHKQKAVLTIEESRSMM